MLTNFLLLNGGQVKAALSSALQKTTDLRQRILRSLANTWNMPLHSAPGRHMYKTILCLCIILLPMLAANAQAPATAGPAPATQDIASLGARLDQVNKTLSERADKIEKQMQALKPADAAPGAGAAQPGDAKLPAGRDVSSVFWLWTMPAILFLIFFIWVARKISIGEALSEKDEAAVKNAAGEDKDPPRSASRLAMFLSGAASIGIAVSFACVFLYSYLKYGSVPDYSTLVQVLLSLGIGVVPYAVNQFNKNQSK